MGLIAGTGLTVIITEKIIPAQPPEVGITVYVAVCTELVGLTSVPLIFVPLPATPPVIPPVTVGAAQL
jgi:hypothetical protein